MRVTSIFKLILLGFQEVLKLIFVRGIFLWLRFNFYSWHFLLINFVIISILPHQSMLNFPLFKLSRILRKSSWLDFVDLVQLHCWLSVNNVFEFFHFQVYTLWEFYFGFESHQFVDFIHFCVELLKVFRFLFVL